MRPTSRSLMHFVRRRWSRVSIGCRTPTLESSVRKFSLPFITVNPTPIVLGWRWSTYADMVGRSHSKTPMAAVSTCRIGVWRRIGSTIGRLSLLCLKRILPRKAFQGHCLTWFKIFPSQAMIPCQHGLLNLAGVFLLCSLSKTCRFGCIFLFLELKKQKNDGS